MFQILKTESRNEWELNKDGILLTNVGISSFIRIFYEILKHVEKQEDIKSISQNYQYLVELSHPYLVELSHPYVSVICDYINNLENDEKIRIKKTYGSTSKTAYQKRMHVVINKNFPEFKPRGIERDIIEFNKTYNDYGNEVIPKLKNEVRNLFEETMQINFGENWVKKLPKAIYKSAVEKQSEKNYDISPSEKEYTLADMLTLEDYSTVAIYQSNWRDYFEAQFSFPSTRKKRMTKDKKINWLKDLHQLSIKDLTAYSITLEENELLEELEKWLLK